MGGVLSQYADKYKELAGPRGANLRKVDTPYLDERLEGDGIGSPNAVAAAAAKGRSTTRRGIQPQPTWDQPTGVMAKPPTGVIAPPELPKGELASIAARVLMKVPYAARMARFDLLRLVMFLAQRITQWCPFLRQGLTLVVVLHQLHH